MTSRPLLWTALAAALLLTPAVFGQTLGCEKPIQFDDETMSCYRYGPEEPPPVVVPFTPPNPFELRLLRYAALSLKHKLTGLASYYSRSLDGGPTASGEVFHNKGLTAAHLTLPLGSWVEIRSLATGRKIRVRVNDRGPYSKFVIDLSEAAAHAIGVDIAADRRVAIRIIALPGEEPLPQSVLAATAAPAP
jgi:rare lipoprotein A